MPAGWEVGSVPAAVNKDAKAAVYMANAEIGSSSVHITRLLRSDLMWLGRDQYDILRYFFQTVRTGDEGLIVLQHGATTANN